MAGLGVGRNEAVIYERGGTRRLFTVPAVNSLEWNRNLDAISRASVVTTPARASTMSWADCCGFLRNVHPWAHELVMYRDGERVWEGPVRRVLQTRAGVTITASDLLGWGERTVVTSVLGTGLSVRSQAQAALSAVFSTPRALGVTVTALGDTATLVDLDVKAGSGYYAGLLSTLVNAGLYYTALGRRVVVWADSTVVLGLTGVLDPSQHIVGDVEVGREGDELATKAYGVNDDGEVGTDGTTDDFYGLVERTVPLAGVSGSASLAAAAARWRAHRYPAPDTLTLPANATLHCDAPFPIGMLVPGVLTPVKVRDLCWPVEQTMMLTGVKVTQDGAGEKVGVTYAPVTGNEDVG